MVLQLYSNKGNHSISMSRGSSDNSEEEEGHRFVSEIVAIFLGLFCYAGKMGGERSMVDLSGRMEIGGKF